MLDCRLSIRSERLLEARLRRLSVVEGSSALCCEEGTPLKRDGGEFAGEVVEEEVGLVSSAKWRFWRRNWHWMHVEVLIEDLVDNDRIDLEDPIMLIESSAGRDACLSNGCMARPYVKEVWETDCRYQVKLHIKIG
jgi:hypothetical protein